ncbi:vacuolar protein sorting-associated protein 51 homolog [Pararge aegeria]|uniref:Vacuolar protein sorting-associated protein 51 homolog n=1 Tax=Pararge aegeria aegeria TaxID=348720 RepID=A0A8S4S497_9NEOP|nr:vacuolar protein sorting-associated protein 51 homolog [Pararge aegeria]CAH2244800.1 jg5150 [Pararge aegeria aegeria]
MSESCKDKENPLDIDGSNFNSEMYLECLLKCASLRQVMDKEAEVVTQSQFLQSEMQTLVYENYNKFISATETVRKMRSDFQIMQEEMNKLSENINNITQFSAKISDNLKESGNNVNRLCSTRQLLDKLQFVFLLPTQLNKAIQENRYVDAVHDYTHAQRVLQKYGDQPSFQSIQTECSDIICDLKKTLRERLLTPDTSASELAESVGLLRQLQETDSSLKDIFLKCAENRLEQHLKNLNAIVENVDLLEWVEKCNNTLLADLAIVISCYHDIFQDSDNAYLPEFADKVTTQVFNLFQEVVKKPENIGTEILIRGLDKFFRKLQAMSEIISSDSVFNKAQDVVIQCINHKATMQYQVIQTQFKENLMRVRQSLASKGTEAADLKEILNSLQIHLMQKVQASLLDLIAFLQNKLSFGLKPWCGRAVADACWTVISETLINLSDMVKNMASMQTSNNIPFELLLILAKLCLEIQENGVTTLHSHLLKLLEESAPGLTVKDRDTNTVMVNLSTAAQTALDSEVVFIGQMAAQMLRVSVLARDWLRAPEPRGPRAVCRRVVETLASADTAASQLFPTSIKPSSDSSRRTIWSRAPSSFSPINRIFSERIEVFSPAGADRAALSNGALKVALKALVECVRLRTFSRHGLQQLQVDVHFLQQRLSCMGNDERLLNALLEDALASAQIRCVDPQLMEPSIVDIICERG